jgi:hypothetical protein
MTTVGGRGESGDEGREPGRESVGAVRVRRSSGHGDGILLKFSEAALVIASADPGRLCRGRGSGRGSSVLLTNGRSDRQGALWAEVLELGA